MSISHHPSDETLATFAAGGLDEARALVVSTHLALCATCRHALHGLELLGGVLLDEIEPAAMTTHALDDALARLQSEPGVPSKAAASPGDPGLPAPLRPYGFGRWRHIARGLELRPVDVASGDDVRVFMLRAQPGIRLPRHRHKGDEWTCVFEGAFRHRTAGSAPATSTKPMKPSSITRWSTRARHASVWWHWRAGSPSAAGWDA